VQALAFPKEKTRAKAKIAVNVFFIVYLLFVAFRLSGQR